MNSKSHRAPLRVSKIAMTSAAASVGSGAAVVRAPAHAARPNQTVGSPTQDRRLAAAAIGRSHLHPVRHPPAHMISRTSQRQARGGAWPGPARVARASPSRHERASSIQDREQTTEHASGHARARSKCEAVVDCADVAHGPARQAPRAERQRPRHAKETTSHTSDAVAGGTAKSITWQEAREARSRMAGDTISSSMTSPPTP